MRKLRRDRHSKNAASAPIVAGPRQPVEAWKNRCTLASAAAIVAAGAVIARQPSTLVQSLWSLVHVVDGGCAMNS